jgi:hypothetical protein
MKYLFLLLFLISCSVQDCRVGPNTTVQTKTETKTDSKNETKNITEQIRDLRDSLSPGAQGRCRF